GLLRHDPLARQRAGDEHGLAAVAAGDATAIVAQVEYFGGKRRLVESGHVAEAGYAGPRIVADAVGARPDGLSGPQVGAWPRSAASRRRRALPRPTSASSCRRTGTTSRIS